MDVDKILANYPQIPGGSIIRPLGSGLINHTWMVSNTLDNQKFVLQQINTSVFQTPEAITANTLAIAEYLSKQAPDYRFIAPLPDSQSHRLVYAVTGEVFRLFPFVESSVTYDTLTNPLLARKAAEQFGKFTFLLRDFPAQQLQITLPDFHNLLLRYAAFEQACLQGKKERIDQSGEIIRQLKALKHITDTYQRILHNPAFKKRVMHHDTKVSNVLFDGQGNALCIIDLDTVMPGYFISDVGDMMRNYLSPANEEVTDLSAIAVRLDYFEAIAEGYLQYMKEELTPEEQDHFVYSGPFLTYMQALRFFTDYLLGDVYYPVKHPEHNLHRTQNQLVLLEKMMEAEKEMQAIVAHFSGERRIF